MSRQFYVTTSSYSNLRPMRATINRVRVAWWLGFGLYLFEGRVCDIRHPFGWWHRAAKEDDHD